MMSGLLLAAENGLDGLPTAGQFGLLITMLGGAGVIIKMLFNMTIKSKDAEITAAKDHAKSEVAAALERVKVAEERASKYEKRLEDQQERIQSEILRVLSEATNQTRRALEITRGSHDDR